MSIYRFTKSVGISPLISNLKQYFDLTRFNDCHRPTYQTRWDIVNWEDGARTIHLSYHQGDHYASVRRLDELKNSKTPSLVSKSLSFTKPTDNNNDNVLTFGKDKNEKSKKKPITKEELYIMETTGCQNLKFIRNVMRDNYNDINATIEFINLIGAKGISQL
jgi:OTU domain-containing protein 3